MDWRQLWDIASAPDNVPIVGMIPLLAFYIYLAWKQAHANDQLIGELETSPAMAKTHHRKTWPFRPGWQKEIHVWPFLLRIEFLAAIIVTIVLMIWSITLYAPLEEPSNPNLTMNPAKAPWYFLGLQEMLVYFDPWIAGVVMPTLIIIGLMVIPYIDTKEAAQVLDRHLFIRIHRFMGFDDYHRDFYPRSRMAMVLARTNLGSQSLDLRSEPRFAGYLRDRFESGESNLRRNCGRRILRDRWLHHARAVPPLQPQRLSADEPAAVFHHAVFYADHGGLTHQDVVATPVSY